MPSKLQSIIHQLCITIHLFVNALTTTETDSSGLNANCEAAVWWQLIGLIFLIRHIRLCEMSRCSQNKSKCLLFWTVTRHTNNWLVLVRSTLCSIIAIHSHVELLPEFESIAINALKNEWMERSEFCFKWWTITAILRYFKCCRNACLFLID